MFDLAMTVVFKSVANWRTIPITIKHVVNFKSFYGQYQVNTQFVVFSFQGQRKATEVKGITILTPELHDWSRLWPLKYWKYKTNAENGQKDGKALVYDCVFFSYFDFVLDISWIFGYILEYFIYLANICLFSFNVGYFGCFWQSGQFLAIFDYFLLFLDSTWSIH